MTSSSATVAVVTVTDVYHPQKYEGLFKECVDGRCTFEQAIRSRGSCWEGLLAGADVSVNFFTRRLWFDVATLVKYGVTWQRFFVTFSSTLCGRQILEWQLSSQEMLLFGTSLCMLAEQFGWSNQLFLSELERIGFNGDNLRSLRNDPAVGLTREFEKRFRFARKIIAISSPTEERRFHHHHHHSSGGGESPTMPSASASSTICKKTLVLRA